MFNYWLTMITPMIHHEPWVPGKAVTWDGFPRPDFDTKKWKTTGNPPAIYGIITMAFTIYHYHGNMVSYGIIWYHMVSHGITWYHMVSSCQKPVATSMFIGFPMGDRSGPRGQQSFEAARGVSGRFGSPVVTTRVWDAFRWFLDGVGFHMDLS